MRIRIETLELFDSDGIATEDVIRIIQLADSLRSADLMINVNGDAAYSRIGDTHLFRAEIINGVSTRHPI